jgi:hypothetical protein
VNCPSVEALRPNHGWGNSRHMQSCRKRKEMKCGEKEERIRTIGIAEENREEILKYREF